MERGICQVPKSIRKNACMLQKGFEGKFNRIETHVIPWILSKGFDQLVNAALCKSYLKWP